MLPQSAYGARVSLLVTIAVWLVSAAPVSDRKLLALPPKASAILNCFEDTDCLSVPTTWHNFLAEEPTCLKPFRIWWSEKPAPFPVTLITQLSFERVQQVRAQCETWSGPLAAALYLPLLHDPAVEGTALSAANQDKLQRAVVTVQRLFEAAESGRDKRLRCQFRLMLVYEAVIDAQTSELYPVNSLRNYARLMADTELVANIDVDMLPSASVSAALADPARLQEYARGARADTVYVIPAFETVKRCGGPSFADRMATLGKADLQTHVQEECVQQMRARVAAPSHNPTEFPRWFSTDTPYAITYNISFEPWFLGDRLKTRWFDARYRGYGKNKIVQVAYTNRTGAAFSVFADGFLVHRAHTESKARKRFLKQKFSRKDLIKLAGTIYEHIETLWQRTLQEFESGTYKPLIEPQLRACLRQLDWWSDVALP